MNSFKILITICLIGLGIYGVKTGFETWSTLYNTSIEYTSKHTTLLNSRGAVHRTAVLKIKDLLKVSKLNQMAYNEALINATAFRGDGPQLMWKWANENNANINYNEVKELYQQLMDFINNEREQIKATELALQKNSEEYYNFRNKIPNSWYLFNLEKSLNYIPIVSSTVSMQTEKGFIDKEDL